MEIIDLTWTQLGIGFIIMLVPAYILWKYRTGLNKKLLTASVRMVLQLLFVGYYLQYLFEYDNPWINAAWIFVMVAVADFATIDRSDLKRKWSVIIPIFGATFLGIIVIDLFFLEVVIQLPKLLAAQYTIPITGMVLGNCLRSNVIGINAFYYSLNEHQERYQFYLSCGATRSEAVHSFFSKALQKSANPTLASMATIGLVSLPGMMTGQILSGSSPLIAIKYQIMIMVAIFSGTILSVYLGILFTNKFVFKDTDMLDETILKN
ncbi:iron export ABC transporter permease subunit FetB [Aliifodinibius salipaludis]|uniref:Iron export ABC transporter permease subunit FetB n=1 Tax=Fodinibius salipaludis TaxID=2032627 RepID=A0A2A2GAH0_9BACT|nr:iron export ABC transporter permease subunit FetB [Aliifodinibius salipaludis]PAU94746.1 iron export ABC transporter permease subunit FetB [Aliifodinibius salipaludis]